MGLYQEWKEKLEENKRTGAYGEFFQEYMMKETKAYDEILEGEQKNLVGNLKDLAAHYSMDALTFTGFLDGINSSLDNKLNLEELDEDTSLDMTIDYEKLYYNMLKAKADWLYNLPQWNGLMSEDKKKDIRMKLHEDSHITVEKVGRNDPCPCGSGKKFKKCCGA